MNVQEWGCFSNFLRSDDVTRTMSKGGGVLVKNPVSAPGPPSLSKILDPRLQLYIDVMTQYLPTSLLIRSRSCSNTNHLRYMLTQSIQGSIRYTIENVSRR